MLSSNLLPLFVIRVEGPVAHDVFSNFFERWNKQAGRYGHLNPVDRRIIDIGKSCVCDERDGMN